MSQIVKESRKITIEKNLKDIEDGFFDYFPDNDKTFQTLNKVTKYGISAFYFAGSIESPKELPPTYLMELPFLISQSSQIFDLIELCTKIGYNVIETPFELPNRVYENKMLGGGGTIYYRPKYFKFNDSGVKKKFCSMYPIMPKDAEVSFFKELNFNNSSKFLYFENHDDEAKTKLTGTFSDDDSSNLDSVIKEDPIKSLLAESWKVDGAEFKKRMTEITSS